MSKTGELLLDKVLAPLLVSLLTPAAVVAASKISTGSYTKLASRIAWYGYTGFAAVIVIWLAVIVIRRRLRAIRRDDGPGIFSSAPYGYKTIGLLLHAGVNWRVRVPEPAPFEYRQGHIDPDEVDVDYQPYCASCNTEIEEEARFWGGYNWVCVRCDQTVRNKRSIFAEHRRASKLARSRAREEVARITGV